MKNIELFLQFIAVAVVSAAAFVSAVVAVIQQSPLYYILCLFAAAALFALLVKFTIKELRDEKRN